MRIKAQKIDNGDYKFRNICEITTLTQTLVETDKMHRNTAMHV